MTSGGKLFRGGKTGKRMAAGSAARNNKLQPHIRETSSYQAITATGCPFTTAVPCCTRNVIAPDAVAFTGLKSFIASTMQTASPDLTDAQSAARFGLPGASLR
jgi:hypothetical protein